MYSNGNVVWFEIPVDDMNRSKRFYSELFGWKFSGMPGAPGNYHMMDTGGADASPDGGMLQRQNEGHRGILTYFLVESVDAAVAKAQSLGGTLCMPKTPVPGKGWFAICIDTEGNQFAVWEPQENPK
jgi:hypothetical protein